MMLYKEKHFTTTTKKIPSHYLYLSLRVFTSFSNASKLKLFPVKVLSSKFT